MADIPKDVEEKIVNFMKELSDQGFDVCLTVDNKAEEKNWDPGDRNPDLFMSLDMMAVGAWALMNQAIYPVLQATYRGLQPMALIWHPEVDRIPAIIGGIVDLKLKNKRGKKAFLRALELAHEEMKDPVLSMPPIDN
jgi:hypothetical protein